MSKNGNPLFFPVLLHMGKYGRNYGKEIKLDNTKDLELAISLHLSLSWQPYWCTKSISLRVIIAGCKESHF